MCVVLRVKLSESQWPGMTDFHNIKVCSLPTRSDQGVLGVGSVSDAILPSCQFMITNALYLHKHDYS